MRSFLFFVLAVLACVGIADAQKAASETQRYLRLICLVHLTGTGQAGDGIVPEFVADGLAAARAGEEAATARAASMKAQENAGPDARPAATKAFLVPRPGIIAWGMQPTDDGKMAILQLVAVDPHAFDAVLADKRPEIRVFAIGRDSKEAIEKEMRLVKRDFSLEGFQVIAQ